MIQCWQRRRFFPKKKSNKRWGTYNRSNISLDSGIANISRSALKICKNITSVLFHSTLVLRTPRYSGSQTPGQSYEETNRKTPATTESRTLHVVFNWHFYCSSLVTRDNLGMLNDAVILHLGLVTSLCTTLTYIRWLYVKVDVNYKLKETGTAHVTHQNLKLRVSLQQDLTVINSSVKWDISALPVSS